MELRDYQKQVIKDLYGEFRAGNKRVLTYAPTGAGKSILIAQIVKDALAKGRRILVVAHRKKLIGQLEGDIKAFTGHKPELITAGRKKVDYDNPVIIAMAQTLARRKLPDDIDVLLGDEIHLLGFMDIWHKCMDAYCGNIWAFSKAFVVGFTATPWRMSNKQGFCHLFEATVKSPSPRKLIDLGFLVNPRIFTYKSMFDPSLLEVDGSGDYTVASISRVCGEEYNKDVFSKWLDIAKDKKTIVFCSSIKSAIALTDVFKSGGVIAETITGKDTDKDCEDILERFKQRETLVLVSVAKLSEGFNDPGIECVLIARPTRSPALLLQLIGRGLRLFPGKDECLILDCGECIEWMTSTKIKGAEVEDPIDFDIVPMCPTYVPSVKIQTKECANCNSEMPIFSSICPVCGEVIEPKIKPVPNVIEFPDLVEFFSPKQRKAYIWIRKEIKKRFLEDKSPVLLFNQYKKKFDHLPPYNYFLGAIFNLDNVKNSITTYHHWLKNKDIHPQMIEFFLALEFGKEGDIHKLPYGISYTREHYDYTYNPYKILGINNNCTEQEVKSEYSKKVNKDNNIILNYSIKNILR